MILGVFPGSIVRDIDNYIKIMINSVKQTNVGMENRVRK